ncbi:butyrate kinase 2 [Clostridium tepidiprofundi DSM 19306]|uniref:Probable butyrate kinase n=1 Tax=Clostridium tepidiprofundi DSM 19306 TaxID=1121338 RepID=A0A151B613_9CLOT|nr:butyrate kinase [Clostridium tepidiprofundi]KYH35243.1 butyrate kinase 2 [Clostridium tepidiprofundi DSM 19306]
MGKRSYVLVINPGSTSTKLALFNKDKKCIVMSSISHSSDEIEKFEKIYDQKDMRTELIMNWLREKGVALNELAAVVGRGGLLRPMPGGTYNVTQRMLEDLKNGFQGQHASNLGGIIANEIAKKVDIPAFIVDPVAVDEMNDVARLSGLPELPRRSLVHALNIKAVTRRVCKKLGKDFEDSSYVVAHLGGGISVSPVKNGRILDVNNANEEGPFSPERAGGLPVGEIVRMAFSGEYDQKSLKKKTVGQAGLVGYLNTNDGRVVDKMIDEGDSKAELVLKAMAYQIAKEIGGMAIALKGDVDAIILTGGLAHNKRLTEWIDERVSFIAPVELVPGEDEMLALAEGAIRVLLGEEDAKIYEDEVKL